MLNCFQLATQSDVMVMQNHTPLQPAAQRPLSKFMLLLILVLPSLFWAGNFVFGRAVHTTLPPLGLSFMRWVIATLVLMPFAWKYIQKDKALYWQYRWRILGLALLGATAFNSLVYVGLQYTTATNGLLLNSVAPILIVFWGVLFYKQRTTLFQLIGLALSFFGVTLIVLQGSWQNLLSLSLNRGDFIILIAVICWSIYTLWLRTLPSQMNKIGLTAIQFFIATLAIFPFALSEYLQGSTATWTPFSILAMAYIGLFPSVFAFLLYTLGVVHAGAARAGLFLHLMPVFGVLLAVIFLKEDFQLYHLLGIASIFTGIALSGQRSRP